MTKRNIPDWINQPSIKQILLSFSTPKTPGQVEKELGFNKLKLKPFLEKAFLKTLNPQAKKGRLYTLTNKSKKLLQIPISKKQSNTNWTLKGWIIASPKQRLIILRIIDSTKRTSEEIRERAAKLNPHLTRISTKGILKELSNKELINTELLDRKRYYWINDKGNKIIKAII